MEYLKWILQFFFYNSTQEMLRKTTKCRVFHVKKFRQTNDANEYHLMSLKEHSIKQVFGLLGSFIPE